MLEIVIAILCMFSTSSYAGPYTQMLPLNLRVHLMQNITFKVQGVEMRTPVTEVNVRNTILPEVNRIWSQAGIEWKLESIVNEPVVKGPSFESDLKTVETARRHQDGHVEPSPLLPLFRMMNPAFRPSPGQSHGALFHIYIFPFIGNLVQGNAMVQFQDSSVVSAWTNQYSRGGKPVPALMTEDWGSYKRGSLSHTIAHELGHVLGLLHHQCDANCLMGPRKGGTQGYQLTSEQIQTARRVAQERMSGKRTSFLSNPCNEIKQSCEKKGFFRGGARSGKGLGKDCIDPILKGQVNHHPNLPVIEPKLVEDCRKTLRRRSARPQ